MPEPGSRLLWRESEAQDENFLFISEDYLGIRQIVNDAGAVSIEKQSNSGWWCTLPIESKVLYFTDDGLKLRSFCGVPLNPTICWQYPMTPAALKSMAYHVIKDTSSNFGFGIEARMVALDFNEPEIRGYSACWFKGELVDFHMHRTEESLEFYQEVDEMAKMKGPREKSDDGSTNPAPFWTYHPLSTGERVEQVWLRTRKGANKNDSSENERKLEASEITTDTAIALVTNQSRTLTLGRRSSTHGEWKCIAKDSIGLPMRVYFNPRLDGISQFAAPTVDGSDKDPLESEIDPAAISEVSIDGVKDVVICREQSQKGHTLISGLLFRYENGKQACVGKFRFDHAKEVLPVADSSCFYLGTPSFDDEKRVLKEICLSKPEYDEESLEWNRFPWKGSLPTEILLVMDN
ncbi:hypothetical protein IL306_010797 [Fusarium sp. DS 682]|nr:hypothetical protein IL306_010797 [Fusarium sp. DS 682]